MNESIDLSKAVYYHEGAFPPVAVDYARITPMLLKATASIARYDQELASLHNPEFFVAPLQSQEAVVSSRMEGTISTMDEILAYDAMEEEQGNKSQVTRSDIIETILYRRTLSYAKDALMEGRPLSNSLLKSMHQMLLSIGRGATKSPGDFKQEQNYIGEKRSKKISYVPISPELLHDGMDRLVEYINSTETGHPELVKTAYSHVEFEALHPFKDGNGRIGRMIITLMLWQSGVISRPNFYISRFMEENKDAYIQLMRGVSEKGEWTEWLLFFLEAIREQAEFNLSMTQQIRALYDEMKGVFSDLTGSRHAIALLDAMFTMPVFKSKQISKISGISPATVNRFTLLLSSEEHGILKIVREGAGRRSALYSFEPLVEVIRI